MWSANETVWLFSVLEYFEGPNWSVHPEWVYCQYDNHEVTDAHSLDTPQKQYLHFLKRMEANKSRFEWRSARFYPSQEVKNNAGGQFRCKYGGTCLVCKEKHMSSVNRLWKFMWLR